MTDALDRMAAVLVRASLVVAAALMLFCAAAATPAPAADLGRDRLAPTKPTGLRSQRRQTSIKLAWRRSRDNRGVARYGLYRDGARVGRTERVTAVFRRLRCGTGYRLGVDAVDWAGNRSRRTFVRASTLPCTGGTPPPPPHGLASRLPAPLPPSAGATFYVAPSGSNSNPGTSAAPWRTIQKALETLTAGQRAFVRAGTYAENLEMSRPGSPLAPITVEAYPGDRPVLTAAGSHPLEVAGKGAYFRFRGFVIQNASGTSGGNVDIYGHHIELSNNEIRSSKDQGVYTDEDSHHVQILANWIHHNGQGLIHQSHGIYLQGDDHVVASNVIHDHRKGFGIQVYDKGRRAIVTGNTITGSGHSGIVVGGSGGVDHVRVVNNVFAFNSHYGISHDSTCPTASSADHNVVFGNGWGPIQGGCPGLSYAGGNRAVEPLFASYAARDLHVLGGSPAVDYAVLEYSWPTDFDARLRSYGSGPDAGAYERPA